MRIANESIRNDGERKKNTHTNNLFIYIYDKTYAANSKIRDARSDSSLLFRSIKLMFYCAILGNGTTGQCERVRQSEREQIKKKCSDKLVDFFFLWLHHTFPVIWKAIFQIGRTTQTLSWHNRILSAPPYHDRYQCNDL